MAESIANRLGAITNAQDQRELRNLLTAILNDIAAIKTALNTHTHGGITTGAGTSGAPNANTLGTLNLTA